MISKCIASKVRYTLLSRLTISQWHATFINAFYLFMIDSAYIFNAEYFQQKSNESYQDWVYETLFDQNSKHETYK